jgi:nucleotide-binding universal stress UspA family protein
MAELKKLLIPVDFSEHSKFAAYKALSLAEVCHAEVYFLHIGPSPKETAETLCQFVNSLQPKATIPIKRFVAQGNPASGILTAAQKLQANAIVMGHRDISGLKSFMQSSVAEQVLREATCPVLIVKKKKQQNFEGYMLPQLRSLEAAFQADRILVPLDFSAASVQAFQYAADLAYQYNATIYTVTVFDKKFKEIAEDQKKHTAILVHGRKIHLWKAFPDLLRSIPYENVKAHVKRLLLDGDPFAKIDSLVKKKEIDLIVMGTNGRSGLEHLLIGSVAEKVLRTIDCPVMTIRAKREALYLR